MKISILLPYKENFSPSYAGAVSLFLRDTVKLSKYRNNIRVFGNTNYKKKLLPNYINLPFKRIFFKSNSKSYIKKFIDVERNKKYDLIEIHNRPEYIDLIHKENKNLVLYYHNNPLDMKKSKSIIERKNVLSKTIKIIFNSKWTMKQFIKGLNQKDYLNKLLVINQSTNKKKVNLKKKEKIILFVGRLNKSKGYDIFGKAVTNVLNEFSNWKAFVIGDESREKIFFAHKRLKILGFQKYNVVSNYLQKCAISVVCSRWDEPFGRVALESSSYGCAVIISNKGGLPEASPMAIQLKNLSSKNLENIIKKLILNEKYRINVQKRIFKSFNLTNELASNKMDKYRKALIKF